MPLIHSKSKKAFKENISKEVHAGKSVKQAVAIAYATKRSAKSKALKKKKEYLNEHEGHEDSSVEFTRED